MSHNPFSRNNTTVFGAPQNSTTPSLFGQKPTTTTFGTGNAFFTNNAFGMPPASRPFGNATRTTNPFGSSTPAFDGPPIKAFASTTPFGGATTTTKPATSTTAFGGVTTTQPSTTPQPFTFPTTTPFATTTTAKPPTATTTPTPPTFAFTTPAAPMPTSFTFNSGPSTTTTTTPALPTTTPELIIDAVTATTPDQAELSERQMQAPMFHGAVLRDLYAFLLNPNAPGRPLPTPSPTASASRFGAALLGKSSDQLDMTNAIDTLAFVDRAAVANTTSLPAGWRVLDEPTLLSALHHMGEVSALPLAAMKAFEKYLARKVATWSDDEAKSLSVQFLVCFGLELTPRLDIHHRIRSTKLTDEEMAVLTSPPYSHFVDQALLERFQRTSNPTTNPSNNSSITNLLALPAPSIPMLAAHEQPPASPRAFSFALPDPPAQAQATANTLSAHAQLFTKV